MDKNEFLNITGQILKNGGDIICLTCTNTPSADILELGKTLRLMCAEFDALLFIFDRIDVAKLAEADGIMLDAGCIPTREVQKLTEENFMLGYFAKDEQECQKAELSGIDFVVTDTVYKLNIPVFTDSAK